jgi:hypothetical protein
VSASFNSAFSSDTSCNLVADHDLHFAATDRVHNSRPRTVALWRIDTNLYRNLAAFSSVTNVLMLMPTVTSRPSVLWHGNRPWRAEVCLAMKDPRTCQM